jgi:hypothetical protein
MNPTRDPEKTIQPLTGTHKENRKDKETGKERIKESKTEKEARIRSRMR